MTKKSGIVVLIFSMAIALIGIIIVQIYWFLNAYEIKEKAFDNSITKVLGQTAEKLESNEAAMFVLSKIYNCGADSIRTAMHTDTLTVLDFIEMKENELFSEVNNIEMDLDFVWSNADSSIEKEAITVVGSEQNPVSVKTFVRNGSKKNRKNMCIKITNDIDSLHKIPCELDLSKDSLNTILSAKNTKVLRKRVEKLHSSFEKITIEMASANIPIEQRVKTDELEKILNTELVCKGIDLPYEYAIHQKDNDSILPFRSENFCRDKATYKHRLFPDEFEADAYHLLLDFPNRNDHIISSMIYMLGGSVVFTITIIVIFAMTIIVIIRQKKISQIKSDFINNMTHEFKTPLATISLAADSIYNPKVLNSKEKILYFTEKIKNENRRLNTLVESVLQIAMIDKNEFRFKNKIADVHKIIASTIDNIHLQIEKRGGEIKSSLRADNCLACVDEMHFSNVILNLLDNANKYTEHSPEIKVVTENIGSGIIIKITDNGIGMSTETQTRIFDKFYRATSGNLHNVKGYGLGLSYVKTIVTACSGTIRVESEKGKGSCFEIMIPFVNK